MSRSYTDQFKIGLLIFPGGIAMLIVAPFAGYFCRAAGSSLLQSAAVRCYTCSVIYSLACPRYHTLRTTDIQA